MPGTAIVPFQSNMPTPSTSIRPPRVNVLGAVAMALPTAAGVAATAILGTPFAAMAGLAVGLAAMFSPKIANQWERAIVLKWGRYVGMRGPGVFWVIPGVHTVAAWIDQRTVTTPFAAEQTLTSDAVPVNVDAVLFWTVYDAEKAALEVQDYVAAVSWAAQTALRDIIGRTSLTELLRGRVRIEDELQKLIDTRTTPWGVSVHSVEMRDVVIPASLQDAMSREAQAAREKQARIILGEAEVEIAKLFEKASEAYQANPTALQLRQMNILYEGLKQKGGMMVVPSTIVDSMGAAGVMAAAALAATQQEKTARKEKDAEAEPVAVPDEFKLFGDG